jgi:hypothetical protein
MTDQPAPSEAGEPFAHFQWNDGWGLWEQVAEEYAEESMREGHVIAAYRAPVALPSFAEGVEASARVADRHKRFIVARKIRELAPSPATPEDNK